MAAGALVGGTLTGVSFAQSGSTTAVGFVAIGPVKILTNKNIAANKTLNAVVTGAATTVPTAATSVKLNVSVTGKSSGILNFYPEGNLSGGSGQFVQWSANQSATGVIEENVGAGNAVTVSNTSAAAATVTMTVVGYSEQVTDGDISGLDGTAGQVLTNTGAGATWQTQGQAYASGTGNQTVNLPFPGPTTVDSVTVPAGSYLVTDTYDAVFTQPDTASCDLVATDGNVSPLTFGVVTLPFFGSYFGSGTVQMLTHTNGGTFRLECGFALGSTHGFIEFETLIATQVNAASGATINATHNAQDKTLQRPGGLH